MSSLVTRVDIGMLRLAFANPVSQELIDEYTDMIMFGSQPPPIKGYARVITEDDVGDYFLSGEEITYKHIGCPSWFVTDGYHRVYAAMDAGESSILVEEDDD